MRFVTNIILYPPSAYSRTLLYDLHTAAGHRHSGLETRVHTSYYISVRSLYQVHACVSEGLTSIVLVLTMTRVLRLTPV